MSVNWDRKPAVSTISPLTYHLQARWRNLIILQAPAVVPEVFSCRTAPLNAVRMQRPQLDKLFPLKAVPAERCFDKKIRKDVPARLPR